MDHFRPTLWHYVAFCNTLLFKDRGSFDQNSVDRYCVLSVDWNFHNQLTKIFDTFQLIEKFDQLPKKNWRILAVDRNFKITKNDINKIWINCQKRTDGFWQLIKTFLKPKIPLLELKDFGTWSNVLLAKK